MYIYTYISCVTHQHKTIAIISTIAIPIPIAIIHSYGKLLVGETKAAATAILKSLCTHYTPKQPTKPSEKRLAPSSSFGSDPTHAVAAAR